MLAAIAGDARGTKYRKSGKDGRAAFSCLRILETVRRDQLKLRQGWNADVTWLRRSAYHSSSTTTSWESVPTRSGGPQKPVPVQTISSVSGPRRCRPST